MNTLVVCLNVICCIVGETLAIITYNKGYNKLFIFNIVSAIFFGFLALINMAS